MEDLKMRLFALLISVLTVVCLQGQTDDGELYGPPLPPPGDPVPVLHCAEPTFDFGEALEGDYVDHTYVLENHGAVALKIENVKTGCGCTKTVHDKEIPPNGKGSSPRSGRPPRRRPGGKKCCFR